MAYLSMDSARIVMVSQSIVLDVTSNKLTSGMVFTSCYKLNAGSSTSTVVTVSGTYTVAGSNSDYTFTSDASCNLDEANGKSISCIMQMLHL